MIIVSQDKKSIYNFDNAKSIDILENEIYITDNILADEGTLIGVYETEERADEVLEELDENRQCKRFMKMDNEGIKTEVSGGIYRMPKE